ADQARPNDGRCAFGNVPPARLVVEVIAPAETSEAAASMLRQPLQAEPCPLKVALLVVSLVELQVALGEETHRLAAHPWLDAEQRSEVNWKSPHALLPNLL